MGTASKMWGAIIGYVASWLVVHVPWLADTVLANSEWVQGLATLIFTAAVVYLFPANKSA